MKSFIAVFAFLLLSVCVINARLFTDDQYRTAFSAWMETHNKVYRTDEYVKRFEIFQDNMDYVHNWNSQNLPTVLGLNFLADLTNEEYQRLYLGTRFTAPRVNIQNSLNKQPRMVLPQTYRPDNNTVDWRVKGAVTPIKDQGQCGSCWSFSTTGSVEGINKISTGNLVSLSEQNLMDCSTAYGNMGCNGGLMTSAFQYIIDNGGIDTEASYPYKMARFNCNFSTINIGAKISGYKNIPSGNEIALASAVNVQPVSVAIDASHNSFQLYQSGIYYEPKCSSNNLDHGVLAIGYGDAGGAGTEYWIVKNSWGTSWGMMGFINMARDFNNQCGIASMASFPTM